MEALPDRDMTPSEYLNATKKAMQIESDYELAKRLEINTGVMSKLRLGSRPISTIIATKIAIALNIDPMTVIADLEAQREKNPSRADFWRSFPSRAG
jgi:hypothetical protein